MNLLKKVDYVFVFAELFLTLQSKGHKKKKTHEQILCHTNMLQN